VKSANVRFFILHPQLLLVLKMMKKKKKYMNVVVAIALIKLFPTIGIGFHTINFFPGALIRALPLKSKIHEYVQIKKSSHRI